MRRGLAFSVVVLLGCPAEEEPPLGGTSGGATGSSEASSSVEPTPTPMPGTTEAGSTSTDSGTSSGGESSSETGAESSGSTTTSTAEDLVRLQTSLGDIVVELDPVAAPITVANFYAYVDAGFYDGTDGMGATVFHRIAPGFVVQGGGLLENGTLKATMPAITNESGNGLTNVRMSVAMARTDNPDSATAQFYFNLVDNFFLDDPPGYAVFGEVVEGADVVDSMTDVDLNGKVPVEPIVILAAARE